MSKVILINPFEVPKGREEECLQVWKQAAEFMRAQPGFIATKLHRAIDAPGPGAKFHFINIAEWESAEDFQAAITSEEFQKLTAGSMDDFPHFPGMYEVIAI